MNTNGPFYKLLSTLKETEQIKRYDETTTQTPTTDKTIYDIVDKINDLDIVSVTSSLNEADQTGGAKRKNILETLNENEEKKQLQRKQEIYELLNNDNEISTVLETIEDIKKEYNEHLKGFKILNTIDKLYEYLRKGTKIFIRYVTATTKELHYGGFMLRCNDNEIVLINKNRKPWTVNVNNYFIFYCKVLSENDKKRKAFEDIIKNSNK